MASRLGPQGLTTRVIAVVIAVGSLAMATLWLRDHWPSRGQSVFCVIAGSVAVGSSSLVISSPMIGFLNGAIYVVLSVFIVCFHSLRLLAVTWSIAAVVLGVLFVRLISDDLAVAVCVLSVAVLLNVFVAFSCRTMIRLLQPNAGRDD
ncbi:GGDEF domain-containing protein, partial [Mycobacterium sp. ITM-2017-0098]